MTRIAITCVAPHERIKAAKKRSRKVAGCSTPGTCLIQRSKARGIMVYANAIARLPATNASSRDHCHCRQIPWGSHEMSVDDMAGQTILQLVKFSSLWDTAKAIPEDLCKDNQNVMPLVLKDVVHSAQPMDQSK
jgi:hypothetical protein